MAATTVSSGVPFLDRLINSFTIGDNVVWQVETGTFVELFCRAFIKESVKEGKEVIYVSFNNSPKNILAKLGPAVNNKHVTIIDCFTCGKGNNAGIFSSLYETTYKKYACTVVRVENPGDMSGFIHLINQIEEATPRGARYVFDSITGVQDLWGNSDDIMKFFTRQCPRLYELDTIAYWIMEKNAHTEQFRAQISHITQAVIDLSIEHGACNLSVIKAENHPERGILKPQRYEVLNSNIEFLEPEENGTVSIGRKIRDIRQQKELSQAQLAAAAGVTPSTISQVENNTITLSLPALVRMARALQVPVGAFFDEKPAACRAPFLFRVKNRVSLIREKELTVASILSEDAPDGFEAHIMTLAPGAELGSHFVASKSSEFGFLIAGSVEFEMNQRTYSMNQGDAVYFSVDVPTRWKNNADGQAQLLWVKVR